MIILVLIGTGVMLARGPVSLASLAPYLEDFINNPAWRYRVRFDDAVLSWEGWQKKLDLVVVGARFVDQRGAELILVPRMSVVFNSQELLAGRIRVTGLELIEPKLHILRQKGGQIVITDDGGISGSPDRVGVVFNPAIFNEKAGGASTETFGDLRELSVRGANLSFHDLTSDLRLSLPSANLRLRQEDDGITLRLSTRLRIGQSEAAFGVSALYQNEASPLIAAVNFAEVHIAGLAKAIGNPKLEFMLGQEVVASGRVDLSISSDGHLDSLHFDVTTGPGSILVPGQQGNPLEIKEMSAKGHFADEFSQLTVADLRLDLGGGLNARAEGLWSKSSDGISLQAKVGFTDLPINKLSTYWPVGIGVNARAWVLANIVGGSVNEGRISVDLRPGDLERSSPRPGMARLDWKFQNVSSKYFGEMPLLRDAKGTGHIDGRQFKLTVVQATTGGLELSEGRLHVADLTLETPILDVEFEAHGTVGKALELLDVRPLKFARALNIKPHEAEGNSAARARFQIPLSDKVNLDQIGFSAAANISGLALSDVEGGYDLKDGTFTMLVDRETVNMSGQGTVNGVPLELTWKRRFKLAAGDPKDQLKIKSEIGTGQLGALGLPSSSRLAGRVGMSANVYLYQDGTRRGAGRFDFTDAALNWPDVGWAKAAAVPAVLNIAFQSQRNGTILLDNFSFTGGGLTFEGSAKFDAKNNLISLTGHNLTFGATRLSLEITVLPNGLYKLDLVGQSLDLRPFVPSWLDGKTSDDEPPLDLNLKIDLVYLTDEVALRSLRGVGRRQAGEWLFANMRGEMTGGQSVGFSVRKEDKGRRFNVIAGDAGGIARALGLYPDARGGTMFLSFLIPGPDHSDDTIIGNLRADNFRVVKAKVLTRLLTLGSLTGLSDALNDKGITFTRLTVPFTMRKRILHIERARAVGPALAIIATGDYARDGEVLGFQGAIVPSYSINSVLGVIPILGELLIGRKGEGVFAFTYKVDGTLARPKVAVNLLSALAPGFLRRIVEGLEKPAVDKKFLKR